MGLVGKIASTTAALATVRASGVPSVAHHGGQAVEKALGIERTTPGSITKRGGSAPPPPPSGGAAGGAAGSARGLPKSSAIFAQPRASVEVDRGVYNHDYTREGGADFMKREGVYSVQAKNGSFSYFSNKADAMAWGERHGIEIQDFGKRGYQM